MVRTQHRVISQSRYQFKATSKVAAYEYVIVKRDHGLWQAYLQKVNGKRVLAVPCGVGTIAECKQTILEYVADEEARS